MEGYHNSETFMSDLNALIYGHQMKMAGFFAQKDVVSKLLQEQITLCDSSQSSETGVQDLVEAVMKRKYLEEELKKIEIKGKIVSKELNNLLFVKLHMQEKHDVQE